jgi:hypothetical protein
MKRRDQIPLTPEEQAAFPARGAQVLARHVGPDRFPHLVAMNFAVVDGAVVMTSYGKAQKCPATDIDIEAREIIKMRERINQIIASETGQPVERVRKDTDRNYWMSAREAIDYGLVSKIISGMEELK